MSQSCACCKTGVSRAPGLFCWDCYRASCEPGACHREMPPLFEDRPTRLQVCEVPLDFSTACSAFHEKHERYEEDAEREHRRRGR